MTNNIAPHEIDDIVRSADVDRAGRLWDAGKDTFDIARFLGIFEHEALRLVRLHRESRWRRRA